RFTRQAELDARLGQDGSKIDPDAEQHRIRESWQRLLESTQHTRVEPHAVDPADGDGELAEVTPGATELLSIEVVEQVEASGKDSPSLDLDGRFQPAVVSLRHQAAEAIERRASPQSEVGEVRRQLGSHGVVGRPTLASRPIISLAITRPPCPKSEPTA